MKTCTKCGVEKTLDSFSKCKRDGLQYMCKECTSACNKAYKEANKEELAVKKKAYRETNKEEIAVKKKAWAKENPEKRRASHAKRRAMKVQVNEDFPES